MSKKSRRQATEDLTLALLYLTRFDDENRPHQQISWKGYDFDALEKMEEKDLLIQARSSRGYGKYVYLTDASLHDPEGKNIMLCGLDVLPEYRKQGLAKELVHLYCRREEERGRRRLVLTCHAPKVKMYRKSCESSQGCSCRKSSERTGRNRKYKEHIFR